MSTFTLKVEDIEPVLTDAVERNLALSTLDIFDGEWCHLLTGIQSTFNNDSSEIKKLIEKVKKLRNLCGPINNNRVDKWQRQYFDHKNAMI